MVSCAPPFPLRLSLSRGENGAEQDVWSWTPSSTGSNKNPLSPDVFQMSGVFARRRVNDIRFYAIWKLRNVLRRSTSQFVQDFLSGARKYVSVHVWRAIQVRRVCFCETMRVRIPKKKKKEISLFSYISCNSRSIREISTVDLISQDRNWLKMWNFGKSAFPQASLIRGICDVTSDERHINDVKWQLDELFGFASWRNFPRQKE